MKHFATAEYWSCFAELPKAIQTAAKKNFEILKENPTHPSLHFKNVGEYRSVRVGIRYRALGIATGTDIVWFWIGSHADYDKLIS